MSKTRELREVIMNFLEDECGWPSHGNHVNMKALNKASDEIARIICDGKETLDDRETIAEMLHGIIGMVDDAYDEGKEEAEEDSDCA